MSGEQKRGGKNIGKIGEGVMRCDSVGFIEGVLGSIPTIVCFFGLNKCLTWSRGSLGV